MSEEWGEWVWHDGMSAPVGFYVQSERDIFVERFSGPSGAIITGRIVEYLTPPQNHNESSWFWGTGCGRVIRYRIRKPKGMKILESLLENLPEEVEA